MSQQASPQTGLRPEPAIETDFDRTTQRWGRSTMLAALCVSLAGPAYLLLVAGFWPGIGPIATGLLAVSVVIGYFWILEPITYYPMLGSAGLYQAFLIGNISNKLLPAAVTAQTAIGAKPGTRRAEIATVAAICGAALVHVISLALLVGLAGTWLLSILPDAVTSVFDYIVPAILGPVVIQLLAAQRQNLRPVIVALITSVAVAIVVTSQLPALAPAGLLVAVPLAVALALALRSRSSSPS